MSAVLKDVEGSVITLEVKVDVSGSMLTAEEAILSGLNEAGCVATGEALKGFDADGSPIAIGGVKWFSKGALPKTYQRYWWRIRFLVLGGALECGEARASC